MSKLEQENGSKGAHSSGGSNESYRRWPPIANNAVGLVIEHHSLEPVQFYSVRSGRQRGLCS